MKREIIELKNNILEVQIKVLKFAKPSPQEEESIRAFLQQEETVGHHGTENEIETEDSDRFDKYKNILLPFLRECDSLVRQLDGLQKL